MEENKKELIDKIEKHFHSPFKEFLIESIEPSIRFLTTNKKTSFSKLGGIPSLPKNTEWPKTKRGTCFSFLLQIDLEEISDFKVIDYLFEKGIISVFFDLDWFNDCKIFYYPNKSDLELATIPEVFLKEQERRKMPFWKRLFTRGKPYILYDECKLEFRKEYMAPSWDSVKMELFLLENNLKFNDIEIEEDYIIDSIDTFPKSNHHLFGYYYGLQASIYEATFFTKGRFPNKLSKELLQKGLEWKLLLQIDSDKLTKMNWMDAGKLLIFIHEKDLEKRNFNDIKVIIDST